MIVYHCTAKDNLKSIMKHGLCPEKFAKMGFPGTVYFSTKPNNGFGELCLEVDLTDIKVTQLSEWELLSWGGTIPSSRIKIYKHRES